MTDPKVQIADPPPAADPVDSMIAAILEGLSLESDLPELEEPELAELVEYDQLRFGGDAAD